MKKYIIFCFVLFLSVKSFAQETSFSKDVNQFLIELERYLNRTKNDEIKQISKQISKNFHNGNISLEDQKNIRDVSNLMLESKMKPSPYFNYFLRVVLQINDDIQHKSKLSSWLEVCENIVLYSSSKKLLKYCEFTSLFLETKNLRDSKSVQWFADYSDFSFQDENGMPYINFVSGINLTCSNRNGSFIIFNTLGKYWIFNNKWEGNKGTIDWKERGFSSDSIFANLSLYSIDIRKSEFKADSVIFYNIKLFNNPIIGEISNKTTSGTSDNNYPLFRSYRKDIVINNIVPDVDYKGGYTLRGSEFIADGRGNASAKIIVKNGDDKILIANSSRFSIKNNTIYSADAAIRIYFDEDSIYHPSLQFTYNQFDRKLKLYRDKKGVSGSPIYSSYHQITIDAELLEWKIDEEMVYLGSLPVTSVSEVNFESLASYDERMYESLRGIDKENPLMLVNRFINTSGKTEFTSAEFALFAGYPNIQIQHYLMNLANKGFLFYNSSQNKAIVQDKLYHYINARLELADYDVIRFQSKISNSTINSMIVNSSLNLSTKDLNIQGINVVSLSDSQLVYIQPYNGKITLKKNRDFDFSGRISVGRGRFVLYGKDFKFNYNDFKVDLNQIDSVQLAVPIIPTQKDAYGNEKLVRIRTVIQAVTGDLKIDDPTNKSGLRKGVFSQYPIFKSFDDSYAYYDNPSIFGGIYARDAFSFHLNAFEIDSLESFDGKGLRFPGTFESAGIFPILEDTLTMMNDYSLGFRNSTSIDGLELYGGKAIYYNNISLSNEGLKGDGKLEYLNSITRSNEIYFFPDSIALFSQEFNLTKIEEGIEFPEINNGEAFALLEPYNDIYRVHKLETGFDFYHTQSTFHGDIILKPTGVTGHGIYTNNGYLKAKMILEKSETSSDLFMFNANWFDADTADLTLFTNLGEVSFKSNNVKTHIDLKHRTGDFFSNGKGSYVELPANQYICYIDKLHWDMDNETLTLGDQDNNSNSIGSKFVSVHPKQDSLSFFAKTSIYDLKDNIISVFGVDEILVADAAIYPSPKKGFFIKKDAFIPTIENARIITNVATKYHEFSDATINLIGNKKYQASGNYTYKDILGNEQHIFFKEISVDKENNTIASGEVDDDKYFKIGSNFQFKGSVNLLASNKYLTFNGYFKANNKCSLIKQEWVRFESEINPKLIRFKLEKSLKNDDDDRLATGVLMNLDSTHIYTAFLSKKERPIDVEVITANTYLSYDNLTSSFIMHGEDSLSNIFIFNENTCNSKGEGFIDLNMDLGQIEVKSIGFVNQEMNNKTEIQMFLLLNFMFSKEALSVMSENIYEAYGELNFTYGNFYSKTLSRLIGKEKSEELIIDIEALDEFKNLPKELNNTISFTDITLVWSDKHQAYINQGKIGLGNVYDQQLNSVMDGWIMLSKKNGNDVLNILLKTEFGDLYFFEYKDNVMFSYSTNEDYNNILIETKSKKRRASEGKNKPPYRYIYCDEERMEKFERKVRNLN